MAVPRWCWWFSWLLVLADYAMTASGTEQQNLVFIHFGAVHTDQALAVVQARCSHPHANITVIVDLKGGGDAKQWEQVASSTGAIIYEPQDYTPVEEFLKRYVHASYNEPEYEAFCFYRFFLLLEYMVSLDLTSAVVLDLDILLFGDLTEHLPPSTSLSDIATLATHWTPRSLKAFTKFMLRFYSRDRVQVAMLLSKVGIPVDAASAAERTPSWWPQGYEWRHMSDMLLFQQFMHRRPGYLLLKCVRNEPCKAMRLMASIKLIIGARCEKDPLTVLDWQENTLLKVWQPHMKNSSQYVPGLHFQGPCKRRIHDIVCHPSWGCGVGTQWCTPAA